MADVLWLVRGVRVALPRASADIPRLDSPHSCVALPCARTAAISVVLDVLRAAVEALSRASACGRARLERMPRFDERALGLPQNHRAGEIEKKPVLDDTGNLLQS